MLISPGHRILGEEHRLSAIADYLRGELIEHQAVAGATFASVEAAFEVLVEACAMALQSGNKLLFFGNGGSAADAQHIATELVVRFQHNRPALPALALTTDSSTLTAIGNDFGFDQLFSRQVEACARPGDVVIGISTSGSSPNILRGLATARERGCVAAGMTGGSGGKMTECASPVIVIPSSVTARIQEMHICVGHALCGALERRLGLVQ